MSEKEIISNCQKWKLDSFSSLYDAYFDQIYKFVYLKTYDVQLSQDITSETFYKALDKIGSFKNTDDSNFKAWIYRIAYNLVVDNYKKDNNKVNIDEIEDIWYKEDFSKNIDDKKQIKEIFEYFETINPRHKQILVMRLWDDLSYKEISQITNESVDNCKKIVSRTLSKIPNNYMPVFMVLLLSIK